MILKTLPVNKPEGFWAGIGNLDLLDHFLEAISADIFALVLYDVARIVAEHAGRLIFLKDNMLTLNIDLKGILNVDS